MGIWRVARHASGLSFSRPPPPPECICAWPAGHMLCIVVEVAGKHSMPHLFWQQCKKLVFFFWEHSASNQKGKARLHRNFRLQGSRAETLRPVTRPGQTMISSEQCPALGS
eukprot:1160624-Pelagomonas_calceolata.AAC.18